jgi:AcrR family transcriptional regulator
MRSIPFRFHPRREKNVLDAERFVAIYQTRVGNQTLFEKNYDRLPYGYRKGEAVLEKVTSFREIRYQEKRKKILENAARIFAKKGYEKASLEEIAAKLQLTKASLYHYIKSKEEMLFLIQMQAIEQVLDALKFVLQSDLNPREKLAEAVKSHVRVATQPHVIGALRQQELILPQKWRSQVIAARDEVDRVFRKIVEEGVAAGALGARNIKISTLASMGALNWTIRWFSPKGELSAEEIAEAMADFILQGFGAHGSEK